MEGVAKSSVIVRIITGKEKQILLDHRKTMEDLEHELRIRDNSSTEDSEQKDQSVEGIKFDLKHLEKCLIVLGVAGSGKTWLMKRLVHQLAAEYERCIDEGKSLPPIPIFILLNEMAEFQKVRGLFTILEFLEGIIQFLTF